MELEEVYKAKREYRTELTFDIIVQKNSTRQDVRKMLTFNRTDSRDDMRIKLHQALDDILDKYFE